MLKLAQKLNVDSMTISEYKGVIGMIDIIKNIFNDIYNEEGFNYSKILKKMNKTMITLGMDNESANELSKAMLAAVLARSPNPKLKKNDFKEIIDIYENQIRLEPLEINHYTEFASFLVLNNERYNNLFKKDGLSYALDLASQGLNKTLNNITIFDIQNNPSFYSEHLYLMNLYTNIESLIFENSSDIEMLEGEQIFDQFLVEINSKDKIKDVLFEPNKDLNLLSYFFSRNDDESILNVDIYDAILFYHIPTINGQTIGTILLYVINPLRNMENEEEVFWEINKLAIMLDEESFPFLYDDRYGSTPGSLNQRIDVFNSLISNKIDTNYLQKEFYKLLFEPAEDIIDNIDPYTIPYLDSISNQKNILIVNDPVLNKLPFDAFIDSEDNFLMEKYVVSYTKSIKSVMRTVNKNGLSMNYSFNDKSSFLVGGINYEKYDYSGKYFKNLSFSVPEISSIIKNNPKSTVLKDVSASESIIKKTDFENVRYLHFSSHGISDSYNFLETS